MRFLNNFLLLFIMNIHQVVWANIYLLMFPFKAILGYKYFLLDEDDAVEPVIDGYTAKLEWSLKIIRRHWKNESE